MVGNVNESKQPLETRLSKNISQRRKSLGLTQAQLAEMLDVDTETLSRFERGKHLPSLVTLEKIADQLAVKVADLLSEKEIEPIPDALLISTWLQGLAERDIDFVKLMIQQYCQHHKTTGS
jgi:transcriptional regulator with XRE-family HTH domain